MKSKDIVELVHKRDELLRTARDMEDMLDRVSSRQKAFGIQESYGVLVERSFRPLPVRHQDWIVEFGRARVASLREEADEIMKKLEGSNE